MLGGGAAAAVLVVALTVVPSPGAGDVPVAASPQPTLTGVDLGEPGAPPEITGDDPLAALAVLARTRDRCFRDLSVLCLEAVDQQQSSALAQDRAALDGLLGAATQPPVLDVEGAAIVERLGDSALVSLGADSDPASVLLMKGEAGWRIRDYIAEGG